MIAQCVMVTPRSLRGCVATFAVSHIGNCCLNC
jgi:hypothetical protein